MSGKHAYNFKDLSGQRFGKRVVIRWDSAPIYRGKKGSSLWLVRCDCGTEKLVSTSGLKARPTCGCENAEAAIRSGLTRRNPIPRKIRSNNGHRLRVFGLTPEAFDEMQKFQDGRCKICQEIFSRTPHIDHNHACCPGIRSCGKCIRGLLCHNCNTALGNLHDSIDLLQKAIDYLKGTSCPAIPSCLSP